MAYDVALADVVANMVQVKIELQNGNVEDAQEIADQTIDQYGDTAENGFENS